MAREHNEGFKRSRWSDASEAFEVARVVVDLVREKYPDTDEADQRTYAEEAISAAFEAITQAAGRKRVKSMQARRKTHDELR
jgi:hypothetical protein